MKKTYSLLLCISHYYLVAITQLKSIQNNKLSLMPNPLKFLYKTEKQEPIFQVAAFGVLKLFMKA